MRREREGGSGGSGIMEGDARVRYFIPGYRKSLKGGSASSVSTVLLLTFDLLHSVFARQC